MADWGLDQAEVREIHTAAYCAGSSAHVKGAYVEIVAATSFPYQRLIVYLGMTVNSGGGACHLTDIAQGAAGAEQVIIPNILLDGARSSVGSQSVTLDLPMVIPAGTRLAFRTQSSSGGTRNMTARLTGKAGGSALMPGLFGSMDNLGAVTGSTNGTSVPPDATAEDTYGNWVEFAAATSRDYRYILPITGQNATTSGAARAPYEITAQIGIGPAGSEVVVHEFSTQGVGQTNALCKVPDPLLCRIPAGTRIAVRAKTDNFDAAGAVPFSLVLLAG